jgi:ribose 5-phosphate isomerase
LHFFYKKFIVIKDSTRKDTAMATAENTPLPIEIRPPFYRRFIRGYTDYKSACPEPVFPNDCIYMTGWHRARHDLSDEL